MSSENNGPVLVSCFDARYAPHLATLMRSVQATSTLPARWYLIADASVTRDTTARLAGFAEDLGLRVDIRTIPEELVRGFDDCGPYPRIVWYRAVLADALGDEVSALYLDCDVLVLHDLSALWTTVLGPDDMFAAVAHPGYPGAGHDLSRLGMDPAAPTFNSGVMLMDLERMRDAGVGERTRRFAREVAGQRLIYPEQDAMNVLFAGRWTRLDPMWNALMSIVLPFTAGASWGDDIHHTAADLERAARSPAIVHFEGSPVFKPWHVRCFHPFAGIYRSFRAQTPWPLEALDGGRADRLFARLPPRAQLWLAARRSLRSRP